MTLQDIDLRYERTRGGLYTPRNVAVGGNLAVDGTLTLGGTTITAATAKALGIVDPTPADYGLISWACPPTNVSSSGGGASGTVYYMRVYVPTAQTITGISLYQVTAGSGLTAGQNLLALLDAAGTRVAVTADQSTAWASGTQVNKDAAFTTPYTPVPGWHVIAALPNGTTPPVWPKGPPSGAANAGYRLAAPYPQMNSGSGQTSIPASVDYNTLSRGSSTFWAGLY